jgi:hypothetical protein
VETIELKAVWLPRFTGKRKIMEFSEIAVMALCWDPGHEGLG